MRGRDRMRARARRGFTLIEVTISLGIMTVGAMGIIALQQHTIRSNSHARQLSIGMQIAQLWVERLKQDAHSWNLVGAPAVSLPNTAYLGAIAAAPANQFIEIPASLGFAWDQDGSGNPVVTGSRAFDYLGNDVQLPWQDGNPAIFYCAAFRPAWVYFGRAMRVDVRVWWPREGYDTYEEFGDCENANYGQLDPGGTLFNDNAFHVVYLSTVIRVTPVTR